MELTLGVAVMVAKVVIVEPWRVVVNVVQPGGHAVSVSRSVLMAVMVTGESKTVVAGDPLLTLVEVIKVVKVDDGMVEVLELELLEVEEAALLKISEDAAGRATEALEDDDGAPDSAVDVEVGNEEGTVDCWLSCVSMTVTETVVGEAGFASDASVTVWIMVVGAAAVCEVEEPPSTSTTE